MTVYDVKRRAFGEDAWSFPADDAPLPEGPAAITKARFLRDREALLARNAPLGLVLVAGETFDGIEQDVNRFDLIALKFLRYADGRPYSLARLARDRHGFKGELRAIGDVLRDQITLMLRVGFDALQPTHEGTIAALRDGTIVTVDHYYQPSMREERQDGGYSWRRRPA
jgi:uncharacterized protein (DUF934 family)